MKDTWSATAATLGGTSNSVKIYKEDGGHTTRIRNLPENQKELALSTLNAWLEDN